MNEATNFPPRPFLQHPTLLSVATAATGLMRQIAIKPFTPTDRRRELRLQAIVPSLTVVHNRIFKEKGSGNIPTIVIGGFVPDATEAVEFQRPLLKRFGSVYYINYSRLGFSFEMFSAQLADLIGDINRGGKKPVIFAVSFGCGLVSRFLASAPENLKGGIEGLLFISPVLCVEDLVRKEREKGNGVRMLESNLRRILHAEATSADSVKTQIERARRCFQSLFEAGAHARKLGRRHLSIRKKIMEVVDKTSTVGGYERVLAMKDFGPPTADQSMFDGPTFVLLAEREEDILVPDSPTLALLRDPDRRRRIFPNGKVRTIFSHADPVPHASLIFHQRWYNPLIEAWYDRLRPIRLAQAV